MLLSSFPEHHLVPSSVFLLSKESLFLSARLEITGQFLAGFCCCSCLSFRRFSRVRLILLCVSSICLMFRSRSTEEDSEVEPEVRLERSSVMSS